MTKPDGIDQSWGFADPKEAKRRGIRVVMMYLSYDPSKNATVSKVRAYHAEGIGVVLGWESNATRALDGAAAGTSDAAEAARQAKALFAAVGYAPKNRMTLYFPADFDTNPSQYPALDAYFGATETEVHRDGFGNGVYAEADYVEHAAGRKLTDSEWQTYAWSQGRVADVADFLQFLNNQTLGGASVDFDRILHEDQIGAWWPPDHPNNKPDTEPDPLEEVMAMYKTREAFEQRMSDLMAQAAERGAVKAINERLLANEQHPHGLPGKAGPDLREAAQDADRGADAVAGQDEKAGGHQ